MFANRWIMIWVCVCSCTAWITIFILYWRGIRWYYRFGPPVLHEEWQSSSDESEVKWQLMCFGGDGDLVVYHWRDGIGLRLKSQGLTKIGRATVSVRSNEKGAVLTYQVRLSVAFPLMLAMMYCAIPVFSSWHWASWIHFLTVVFWLYFAFFRNDRTIREFERLPKLRRQLQQLGVHVCSNCGYDLFQRDLACTCPECGMRGSASITRARQAPKGMESSA